VEPIEENETMLLGKPGDDGQLGLIRYGLGNGCCVNLLEIAIYVLLPEKFVFYSLVVPHYYKLGDIDSQHITARKRKEELQCVLLCGNVCCFPLVFIAWDACGVVALIAASVSGKAPPALMVGYSITAFAMGLGLMLFLGQCLPFCFTCRKKGSVVPQLESQSSKDFGQMEHRRLKEQRMRQRCCWILSCGLSCDDLRSCFGRSDLDDATSVKEIEFKAKGSLEPGAGPSGAAAMAGLETVASAGSGAGDGGGITGGGGDDGGRDSSEQRSHAGRRQSV